MLLLPPVVIYQTEEVRAGAENKENLCTTRTSCFIVKDIIIR